MFSTWPRLRMPPLEASPSDIRTCIYAFRNTQVFPRRNWLEGFDLWPHRRERRERTIPAMTATTATATTEAPRRTIGSSQRGSGPPLHPYRCPSESGRPSVYPTRDASPYQATVALRSDCESSQIRIRSDAESAPFPSTSSRVTGSNDVGGRPACPTNDSKVPFHHDQYHVTFNGAAGA